MKEAAAIRGELGSYFEDEVRQAKVKEQQARDEAKANVSDFSEEEEQLAVGYPGLIYLFEEFIRNTGGNTGSHEQSVSRSIISVNTEPTVHAKYLFFTLFLVFISIMLYFPLQTAKLKYIFKML